MNLDWKKLGVIALFIGAVILFGFFIYYFFFRPLVTPPDIKPTNINAPGQLPLTVNINGRIFTINANTGLPTLEVEVEPLPDKEASSIAHGGITKINQLTTNPSFFAVTTIDGNIIYYNPADGKFYIVSPDGTIKEFSDKIFHNVVNATWSGDTSKAILEYPDGSNVVYNFKTNKQVTLPQHWYSFDFSPTDQQIAFKSNALDPENRFLAVSKDDGTQPIILENIGDQGNRFDVNWSPNNQMVATYTKGKDSSRSEVYFVGLNNENFKLMIVEGRDFRGQWSPRGDKMIYSVYDANNDFKPQLWISDVSPGSVGNNRKSIDLNTWADKCTFSSNNKVYCAVPVDLPYGAGMDDASANNVVDEIYEIDLNTGSKSLVAIPDGKYTIDSLMVDKNSDYLFFTERNNNMIYKINL